LRTVDSNHYKFTGKERDAETGLDYFGARHYSNGLGRFITPDWSTAPVPVPYADLSDPQSLNQYSYVRNIPTTRFDADGHETLFSSQKAEDDFDRRMQPIYRAVSNVEFKGVKELIEVGSNAVSLAKELNSALSNACTCQESKSQNDNSKQNNHNSNQSSNNNQSGQGKQSAAGTQQGAQKPSTLGPGPHAGKGTPARGPQRDFKAAERQAVNNEGQQLGCHTCGTKDPGTKSGNFIPDHQPPNGMNPNNDPQRLYPHCVGCSRKQGGDVNATSQKN
jgi:RHS repeat-associated protein